MLTEQVQDNTEDNERQDEEIEQLREDNERQDEEIEKLKQNQGGGVVHLATVTPRAVIHPITMREIQLDN